MLQIKLVQSNLDLDRVTPREGHGSDIHENRKIRSKRLKFVIAFKVCLNNTVNDLEAWRGRFDPSWWLILRLKNPIVDTRLSDISNYEFKTESLTTLKELRSKISAQESSKDVDLDFMEESSVAEDSESIADSQAKLTRLNASGRDVLIDTINCDPNIDPAVIMKDVQDLVGILANADPSRFSLLTCCGAIKYQNHGENATAYGLLFSVPSDGTGIQSLREFLRGNPSATPLNERIDIAVSLARAVLFLHTSHFVHKSIRPENVIIVRNRRLKIGKPYLVGFEKFRVDTTSTLRYGDDFWEKNLYRHPQRQGMRPQEDFIMQHDVYSLGVVLLELGMSISFLDWPDGRHERPAPDAELEISGFILTKKSVFGKANAIKERLTVLAESILPNTFGQRYSEIVVSCLTCLDKDNQDFGDSSQFEDDDGVSVGVRYLEKVSSVTLSPAVPY